MIAMPDDKLPPISFASRGFVRKDGSVFGWSLLSGEHRDYHQMHGTSDADFLTRWRQWNEGGRIDFEDRTQADASRETVEQWISDNADAIIPIPRPS